MNTNLIVLVLMANLLVWRAVDTDSLHKWLDVDTIILKHCILCVSGFYLCHKLDIYLFFNPSLGK